MFITGAACGIEEISDVAITRHHVTMRTVRGHGPVIPSDLEMFPVSDNDSDGQGGWRPIGDAGPSRSADEGSLIRTGAKTAGVRPDRAQGAHEHEAKEHDLPLVRQRRA